MSGWITTWAPVVPPVLVAVSLLVVPGLLVALAAGARGIAALGLAPPLSVTVVSLTAVVAGLAGGWFGLAWVVGGTVISVALTWVVARVIRVGPPLRDTGRQLGAALGGAAVGGACAAVAVARGIGTPSTVPQTFDSVFHLNAVWRVLQSGDGSSLTLGKVAAPDAARAFYPAAWHDVTALVAQLSGASIPVSTTAVSLAIVAVVWPLGCLVFARQALGRRAGILFTTGVVAAGVTATPYLLLSYGTLWPNALATALLPAVLACVVAALRIAPDDAIGWRRGLLLGAVMVPGLTLAHPNAVLSALLFATVIAGVALWHWAQSTLPSWRRTIIASGGFVVLLIVEFWLMAFSPLFAATRHISWPAGETMAQAAGEWLLAAPMRAPIPALMAAVVLVGLVSALRRPPLRWLAICHLASGATFALVAGSDSGLSRDVSGPYYDDPFRLAALLGITAVPLAALGLEAVAAALLPAVVRLSRSPLPRLLLPALAVVLVVVSGGMYAGANAQMVNTWYAGTSMVGPEEEGLLQRLPEHVPAGTVVAGNPWNGSALTEALGSRQVLFPHLSGAWGTDRDLVAQRLDLARSDPRVCSAVRRLHVGYVLDGQSTFWPDDARQTRYAGLDVSGQRGFVPVDHGGRLTLYRITACG